MSPLAEIDPHASDIERLSALHAFMQVEIDKIMKERTESAEKHERLVQELRKTNRAYESIEMSIERIESERDDIRKERDSLKSQLIPDRIVVIIDADGAIFDLDLVAKGLEGGRIAAEMMTAGVMKQFPDHRNHEILVYAFLNKRGLATTFGRVGNRDAKCGLDEFMIGFNQASEHFLITDVGGNKEAADAKVKAFLRTEIRCPQNQYVIVAVNHDKGYLSPLLSSITKGSREKLVLLRGYNKVVDSIADLRLATFQIPGLFIREKLDTNTYFPQNETSIDSPAMLTINLSRVDQVADPDPVGIPDAPQTGAYKAPHRRVSISREAMAPSTPSTPPSGTPERWSPVTSSTWRQSGSHSRSEPAGLQWNAKKVNRSLEPSVSTNLIIIAIPSQSDTKKRACTQHYLSPDGCYKKDCSFTHEGLTESEVEEFREKVKGTACNYLLNGGKCPWGDECVYGHKCPRAPSCPFVKLGTCWFKEKGMHTLEYN